MRSLKGPHSSLADELSRQTNTSPNRVASANVAENGGCLRGMLAMTSVCIRQAVPGMPGHLQADFVDRQEAMISGTGSDSTSRTRSGVPRLIQVDDLA